MRYFWKSADSAVKLILSNCKDDKQLEEIIMKLATQLKVQKDIANETRDKLGIRTRA